MSPSVRGFFFIHEAMHSYLPFTTPDRNNKLRGMVARIQDVYKNKIKTTAKFHLQMKKNLIQFPLTSDQLKTMKNGYFALLGDEDEQRNTLLSAADMEALYQQTISLKTQSALLAPWDQKPIKNETFEQVVSSFCQIADIEVVQKILNSNLKTVNFPMLCLGANGDSTIANTVLASPMIRDSVSQFYSSLISKEVTVTDSRISINSESIPKLAINPSSENTVPLLSLSPAGSLTWDQISEEGRGFETLVESALKNANTNTLDSLIFKNEDFKKGFSIQDVTKTIESIQGFDGSAVSRERPYAQAELNRVMNSYWKTFLFELSKSINSTDVNEFSQKIKSLNLGYGDF